MHADLLFCGSTLRDVLYCFSTCDGISAESGRPEALVPTVRKSYLASALTSTPSRARPRLVFQTGADCNPPLPRNAHNWCPVVASTARSRPLERNMAVDPAIAGG